MPKKLPPLHPYRRLARQLRKAEQGRDLAQLRREYVEVNAFCPFGPEGPCTVISYHTKRVHPAGPERAAPWLTGSEWVPAADEAPTGG